MEKKQNYKLVKVFLLKDLPTKVKEYIRDMYADDVGGTNLHLVEYKVSMTPSPEWGNEHVYTSKWFVENGAVKEEIVIVDFYG